VRGHAVRVVAECAAKVVYASDGFLLGFDYAWRYMGVLGGTNFFTVNLGW
jgi:hypothetical protein